MFERSWVLVMPLLAKGIRYYNFFESFRPKFTFLECEKTPKHWTDQMIHDRSSP